MSDKITETALITSQGRSILQCESAFALATRVSGPTPVVTHSGDVSRLEPTTCMVLRSRRGVGRSSAAIPDVVGRPEMKFRQDPEVDNPAEIQVSVSTATVGGLGAAGPTTADRPSEIAETVSTYWVIRKQPPNHFPHHRKPKSYFHIVLYRAVFFFLSTMTKVKHYEWIFVVMTTTKKSGVFVRMTKTTTKVIHKRTIIQRSEAGEDINDILSSLTLSASQSGLPNFHMQAFQGL